MAITRENIEERKKLLQDDVNSAKQRMAENEKKKTEDTALLNALAGAIQQCDIFLRELDNEVGPVKYIAQLIYGENGTAAVDSAVQIVIMLLIFVFDPLAIILVIAANFAFARGVDGGEVYRSFSSWANIVSKRHYIKKRV